MTEKTAVFEPIPTAITTIATVVNPGAFSSDRAAKRMSRQVDSSDTKEEPLGMLCPSSGLFCFMPLLASQRSLPFRMATSAPEKTVRHHSRLALMQSILDFTSDTNTLEQGFRSAQGILSSNSDLYETAGAADVLRAPRRTDGGT